MQIVLKHANRMHLFDSNNNVFDSFGISINPGSNEVLFFG